MILVALHIAAGMLILATIWVLCQQKTRDKLIRWWSKGLLWRFNIQVVTHGKPPAETERNCMVLANHVSWIDIHALNSVTPVRFIAKSDINNWPILGYLARKSGTIFINRNSRKDTARIVDTTVENLTAGNNVAFFPEGTTTDGTCIAHFKSSIIQAAMNANASIYPVAIRYPSPDGGVNPKLSYAGETTMAESMMHVFKTKYPVVELHFLPTMRSDVGSRQSIAKEAQQIIAKTLDL